MSDSKPLSKTIPQTMNEMQMKAQESKETESIRKRMTNLTDQRFGRLVAEYPTKRRDHKGSVYWHCHCDCGQNTELWMSEKRKSKANLSTASSCRWNLGRVA